MKLSGRGLATTIIIALAAGQLCVIGLRNFLDFIWCKCRLRRKTKKRKGYSQTKKKEFKLWK